MPTFKDMSSVETYIKERAKLAMRDTMEELREKLLEYIEEDIYGAYDPSFYVRTYELLNESDWQIYSPWIIGNGVYSNMIFKNQKGFTQPAEYDSALSGSSQLFTHGNYIFGGLAPYELIEILNTNSSGDAFNFPHINRKSFFDDFMEYAEKNYASIFARNCVHYGVPLSYGAKSMIIGQQL